MAKLLAYHTLPPVTDQFLGFAKDAQDDRIICTYGRNLILLLETSTRKNIKSWNTEERLLKRVVFDSETRQYVGLFDSRIIKCWTENTQNITKVKRNKLTRPVHEIITVHDGRALILYSNSFCESLSQAINRSSSKTQREIEPTIRAEMTLRDVLQPRVILTKKGEMIFSYFTKRDEGDGDVQLSYVEIDSKTLEPLRSYTRIRLPSVNINEKKLSGYTLVDSSHGLELLSIWSDNTIFVRLLDIKKDDEETNTIGNFIANLNIIDPTVPMSIVGLKDDYIAIYAANNTKDGASVILYNTQFKVVQSKQSFKVYFPESEVFVIQNNIFLMASKILAMIPFRLTKNRLSDLIGSQRGPEIFEHIVDRQTISEFSEFESQIYFDPSENATSNQVEKNVHYNDPKKLPKKIIRNDFARRTFWDIDEIEEQMSVLSRDDIVVDVVESDIVPPGKVGIRISKNSFDTTMMKPQFELLAGQLERCGAGETEITERLIPLLLEGEVTSDIIITLRRYTHVSERALVRVIKYAINCPEPTNDESKEGTVDLLNVVLSCTYESSLIMPHIRNELNLNEVLYLLKYLYKIYKSDTNALEERPDTALHFNEDKQIIDWVTLLLDAHYQQICISKDSNVLELIKNWKEIINDCVEALIQLNSLSANIQQLAEGKNLASKKQHCKFYSIEKLKLY